MNNADDPKPATQKSNIEPPSISKPVESENIEPPIPDWVFKVVEMQTEKPAVHQRVSDNQESVTQSVLVDRIRKSDRWMIVFTAIIAISAVVNLVIFWLVSTSTSKQTDRIIIEANRMAGSLENTVERNKLMLDEYRISNRLDQRAWIGLKHMTMARFLPNQPILIVPTFVNIGRTLALRSRLTGAILLTQELMDAEKLASQKPKLRRTGEMTLSPNFDQPITIRHDPPISQDTYATIKAGKLYVYMFGTLTYKDIFGEQHFTEVCGLYKPERNQFDVCDFYNRAN